MSITKTTTPYEFLARWKNGALAGAHVKFLETITDDGAVVSQREGDPMSVAVAGAAGFPLDDILSALQTQAIAERDAAIAAKQLAESHLALAISDKASELDAKDTEHAQYITALELIHTQGLAAKDAEIAALEAQVAELAPPTVNGVPQVVTRRQARQALLLAGLLDSVEAAIAAIPDATQRRLAQIEWADSQNFERQRPLLVSLATALGLTSAQLDQLFVTASGL